MDRKPNIKLKCVPNEQATGNGGKEKLRDDKEMLRGTTLKREHILICISLQPLL